MILTDSHACKIDHFPAFIPNIIPNMHKSEEILRNAHNFQTKHDCVGLSFINLILIFIQAIQLDVGRGQTHVGKEEQTTVRGEKEGLMRKSGAHQI